MRFYCQHWDWGYSLFSILYSQVPGPRSQVPVPVPSPSPSRLTILIFYRIRLQQLGWLNHPQYRCAWYVLCVVKWLLKTRQIFWRHQTLSFPPWSNLIKCTAYYKIPLQVRYVWIWAQYLPPFRQDGLQMTCKAVQNPFWIYLGKDFVKGRMSSKKSVRLPFFDNLDKRACTSNNKRLHGFSVSVSLFSVRNTCD